MASAFPSSGFFAGGSWAAERLTAATHTTATVSTENIHLISGSSLQKRVYTNLCEGARYKNKKPLQSKHLQGLLDNRFFRCRTWHAYSTIQDRAGADR